MQTAKITEDELMELISKLHERRGLDFSLYKRPMLIRRIQARMKRLEIDSCGKYATLLEKKHDEVDALLESLNINVTEFFRNPESFAAITSLVIPKIVEEKIEKRHRVIRAWSAGCSSGDEPYSVAMAFMEVLGEDLQGFTLSVIGSDIDKGAIAEAKRKTYEQSRLKSLSPGYIKKYFKKKGDLFEVRDEVVSNVTFEYRDVVNMRPHRFCDLITCRNLLIYFNRELQEETQLKFAECLNPGGFLVLGMVETLIGSAVSRFAPVDGRLRIYSRLRSDFVDEAGASILSQDDIDGLVGEILK